MILAVTEFAVKIKRKGIQKMKTRARKQCEIRTQWQVV